MRLFSECDDESHEQLFSISVDLYSTRAVNSAGFSISSPTDCYIVCCYLRTSATLKSFSCAVAKVWIYAAATARWQAAAIRTADDIFSPSWRACDRAMSQLSPSNFADLFLARRCRAWAHSDTLRSVWTRLSHSNFLYAPCRREWRRECSRFCTFESSRGAISQIIFSAPPVRSLAAGSPKFRKLF